tara:strand:- start:210 stop:824 length:615 start_codon:yes stop_codon:yes gene_type:complete
MADITTLQQSLINAKKVMNKVDGGNFSTGNVNLSQANVTDSTGLISNNTPESMTQPVPSVDVGTARQDLSPKSSLTEDRIKKSKLPDAIKQAMIDNPIPDIPFNGGGVGLSNEFLSGVQEQMSKQGLTTTQPTTTNNSVPPPVTKNLQSTKKITSKNLKSIIKESVKELLDETIGFKKNSNENFQFRVGDRIFYGKITSSKSVK